VIGRLRRLRAEILGLNRRNHAYLFRFNRPDRYRLVDDKQATKRCLAAERVPVPRLYEVCTLQGEVRSLVARLRDRPQFVLKPARGAGGAGIVVVVGRDGDRFVKASGRSLPAGALEAHGCDVVAGVYSIGGREDTLLVEQRVVPEPTLAAYAYRGVPDVRVLVFRGVPVLAMLRLPTRRSDGRANLHLGGIGVGIDIATGRSTFAVIGGRDVTFHPDLGRPLAGLTVPLWNDILLLATRAADAVGLGMVGVDVVVDEGDGPLVLELNARPGLTIQVANRRGLRPLLERLEARALPESAAERVTLGRELAPR
jgi:alpha-L-glutamate ligase-like protein